LHGISNEGITGRAVKSGGTVLSGTALPSAHFEFQLVSKGESNHQKLFSPESQASV
jgi:hypothetical protein